MAQQTLQLAGEGFIARRRHHPLLAARLDITAPHCQLVLFSALLVLSVLLIRRFRLFARLVIGPELIRHQPLATLF